MAAPRLSSARLLSLHEFLLQLHAAGTTESLRWVVPVSLAKLIACDRAAFNEFGLGPDPTMVPTPRPAYWDRFSPVLAQHLHEHALTDPGRNPRLHQAVTFGDFARDSAWRRSTLYHEYYLPVGAKQQLSVHCMQTGSARLLLNCNRSGGDFSATDRTLIEIVSRHVACAWTNISGLKSLPNAHATGADQRFARCVVELDSAGRVRSSVGASVHELSSRFFGRAMVEGRVLPDALRRWVVARRRSSASLDTIPEHAMPLVVRQQDRRLTVRIAQSTEAATMLLLEEQPANPAIPAAPRPV